MEKTEIDKNIIYMMMRGSQAYGTNTPESDIDIGGICLPSKDVFFGIDKFEQDDTWVDENGEKSDKVVYAFGKAIDLMAENNPNMLDFLCAPQRCVLQTSPQWEKVKDAQDLFISKETKSSFLGYALSQLGRIQTHRQYLLNPVKNPVRSEYGLPETPIFPETQYESITKMATEFVTESQRDQFYAEMAYMLDTDGAFIVKKFTTIGDYQMAIEFFKVRQEQFLRMMASIKGIYLDEKYRDMARLELKYISDLKNYKRYLQWDKSRNEKRKALERKCGFDSKHGSHLLRLTRMAAEIMEGKGIRVDRTGIDAEELLDIRLGNQSFDEVMKKAETAREQANTAYRTSTLPLKPDYTKINDLKREILDQWGHTLFK